MNRDELVTIIEAAAERHNVPADALLAIANLESTGDVNAKNPRSSASGLFQFVDSTAREYGLTGSKRNDPEAQANAAAKMMATNSRSLSRVLGREPDAGELYLAHQQGLGGATALIRGGDGLAVDALTGVYRSRAKAEAAIRLNGGDLSMSASAFAGKWISRANREVGTIPSGKIPNTVASVVDVVPRSVQGFPTPRPVNPANPPLPRLDPRKPNRMDLAADVPTGQQRLPDLLPTTMSFAGQERGPVTARPVSETVQREMTKPTVSGAVSFAGQERGPVSVAPRKSAPLTIGAQSSFAGQDAAKFVAGPASVQKDQSRLTTPAALPAPTGGLNKQQVEAATGFRLGNGSVLTSTVEVENPAYARLMQRVQQGEMELRGISAGGMALSRDARARYDASLKALEAQRQQLANTSRTINVQRQQRAPVAVPVQSGGVQSSSGGGQSFQGTHTGRTYNPGPKSTMGGDTYTANAKGGFTNDRTGRSQGKGSTYYDPDSNTFRVR